MAPRTRATGSAGRKRLPKRYRDLRLPHEPDADRDDPEPAEGDPLPPCWHWLYFAPAAMPADIGHDGHPAKGGFLPPIPYPRRMWAGSRIRFDKPLRVGDRAIRTSEIADIAFKEGRTASWASSPSGISMPAATGLRLPRSRISSTGSRRPAATSAPPPQEPPGAAEIEREIVADPVMLFRYSALTFNGHRIHYDQPYVTGAEGYPGLIVHGPLIATLLVDLVRRNDADVAQFPVPRPAAGPSIPARSRSKGSARATTSPCGRSTMAARSP